MLAVGIVGLPNVGKSTLFNALTRAGVRVSSYPFTTIDANVGMAAVPDPRLDELERLLDPSEAVPCAIEFIDIAGLVEGASRGEGLGNQFLGNVRAVDVIVHVLRCFEHPEVAHVYAEPDPVRDAEVVETELLLADLEVLTRSIARQRKLWKADPGAHREEEELMERLLATLEAGRPLRSLGLDAPMRRRLKALGMLSAKPVIYVANLSEDEGAQAEPAVIAELRRRLSEQAPAEVVGLSAQLELELAELEPGERAEFMAVLGMERTGIARLVERAFEHLDLIRFYTVAHGKLRAWEVPRGTAAPTAAGKVHTDMESGFVRAEVASFDELRRAGSLEELRHEGRLRTEGKSYEIGDGDVVQFLFTS